MNSEVKRILDAYLSSCYLNKEIEAFAKFFDEGPGATNHEPSLSHIISLLEELNRTRVPDLVARLEGRGLAAPLREIADSLAAQLAEAVGRVDESGARIEARRAETDALLAAIRAKETPQPTPEEDLSMQEPAALEMDEVEATNTESAAEKVTEASENAEAS